MLALLEALSGQHRGNMFDGVKNDVDIPATVWKVTIGEMLFPNIWREMPMRLVDCYSLEQKHFLKCYVSS